MRFYWSGRFWAKVDKRGPDECWPWLGSRTGRQGYGHFKIDGRTHKAHRVAFELATGIAPGAQVVHHQCETKHCVNPAHLSLMPHGEHSVLSNVDAPHHQSPSNGKTKLTAEQVAEIRSSPLTQDELAKLYGISQPNVSHIKTGTTWRSRMLAAPFVIPTKKGKRCS